MFWYPLRSTSKSAPQVLQSNLSDCIKPDLYFSSQPQMFSQILDSNKTACFSQSWPTFQPFAPIRKIRNSQKSLHLLSIYYQQKAGMVCFRPGTNSPRFSQHSSVRICCRTSLA